MANVIKDRASIRFEGDMAFCLQLGLAAVPRDPGANPLTVWARSAAYSAGFPECDITFVIRLGIATLIIFWFSGYLWLVYNSIEDGHYYSFSDTAMLFILTILHSAFFTCLEPIGCRREMISIIHRKPRVVAAP